MKKKIRSFVQNKLGYWFYKSKHLPIGTDISVDLTSKIHFPIRTIVDVGANVGQSALFYHELFPESKIYCFEPVPAIFGQLTERTKNLGSVRSFQMGVGESIGSLKITLLKDRLAQQHSFKTVATDEDETLLVPVTTIDEIIRENRIETIDLLKIDTEGFELEVLKGALKSIENNQVKLIYLEVGLSSQNTHNSSFLDVFRKMEELGFTFYGLYEISHIGLQANHHYGNALFIHHSALNQVSNWQLN